MDVVDPMSVAIFAAITVTMLLGTLGALLFGALCVLRLARLFGPAPKLGVARAERPRLRVLEGRVTQSGGDAAA